MTGQGRRTRERLNPIEWTIRRVDTLQQSKKPLAFAFGVVKKFGDDAAGSHAALIAYYGFLSLFPLMLVLITVLGLVLSPGSQQRVIHSTLAQFPIVGDQLSGPDGIRALKAGSGVGLVVGLIGLVWGSLGVTQAAQRAMAEIWNVPGIIRPGFFPRLGRSLAFLGVLVMNVVTTSGLAALMGASRSPFVKMGVILLAVGIDMALYLLAFRVLTPKSIPTKALLPGAILAGGGWAILQYAGAFLVIHQLRHTSQIYGYFASVLGLIAFLFIAAEITLYAAEFNVVRERHLYPRSIVQPPLTEADRRVLAGISKASLRRPEQQVDVGFPDREGRSSTEKAR
ncbi:MAG: YihY/virulence factor BrkB family protein [Actinomycetota bacterium]